jgi:MFS family permease
MNLVSSPIKKTNSRRKWLWLGLLAVIAVGIAIVFIPIWLIIPFKPQTQRGLEISLILRRFSPVATILASLGSITLIAWMWRGSRWFGKVIAILIVLPLFAATWMARQNHFEWMFRPHANVGFVRAPEANFIADSDMVLAVKNNGEAAAYPVRFMAYHHVVHDTVGGVPLVATY